MSEWYTDLDGEFGVGVEPRAHGRAPQRQGVHVLHRDEARKRTD